MGWGRKRERERISLETVAANFGVSPSHLVRGEDAPWRSHLTFHQLDLDQCFWGLRSMSPGDEAVPGAAKGGRAGGERAVLRTTALSAMADNDS